MALTYTDYGKRAIGAAFPFIAGAAAISSAGVQGMFLRLHTANPVDADTPNELSAGGYRHVTVEMAYNGDENTLELDRDVSVGPATVDWPAITHVSLAPSTSAVQDITSSGNTACLWVFPLGGAGVTITNRNSFVLLKGALKLDLDRCFTGTGPAAHIVLAKEQRERLPIGARFANQFAAAMMAVGYPRSDTRWRSSYDSTDMVNLRLNLLTGTPTLADSKIKVPGLQGGVSIGLRPRASQIGNTGSYAISFYNGAAQAFGPLEALTTFTHYAFVQQTGDHAHMVLAYDALANNVTVPANQTLFVPAEAFQTEAVALT